MAGENSGEPFAEDETVEAGGWRDKGRVKLTPKSLVLPTLLQDEACQPEKRLSQKGAADPAHDLVVDRRVVRLAPYLPEIAAHERVEGGRPVVETRGPRETVVDGPLIGDD